MPLPNRCTPCAAPAAAARRAGLLLLLTLALALPVCAPARGLAGVATATLDQVDVAQVERELIGIRDGGTPLRIDLFTDEDVLWLGARGTVGAVLTDRRFLAFSLHSAGWQEVSLGRGDDAPTVLLASNLAMALTPRRVLGFASFPGVIREAWLSPNEQIVAADAEENVGAVITNRRVLGLSGGRPNISDRSLFVHEDLESLSTRASSVTVRTTQRLLVYKNSGGGWFEARY